MEFHLVDGRDRPAQLDQLLHVFGQEVGNADGTDTAVDEELFQGQPRILVLTVRGGGPVDQVEVQVIEAQLRQAGFEGGQRRVVTEIINPELGRDEQFVPGDPGFGQRAPGARLVAVDGGGVDAPVSGGERCGHGCGGLHVRNLEDAEAQLRHLDAVVESDGGY